MELRAPERQIDQRLVLERVQEVAQERELQQQVPQPEERQELQVLRQERRRQAHHGRSERHLRSLLEI